MGELLANHFHKRRELRKNNRRKRSLIVGRGEQLSVARPPGRVVGAPQAQKVKNHRVE